ncbi:Leucokinin [Pseudolycoriella hygida]|uniref:Leucokinin n=1 Tax=Pseudolycoriella hygida TaxID=35572 RepID=A0A9Q0RXJ3_9DIPT|nr:Leucokinin [Pseudolycoriella hygida]
MIFAHILLPAILFAICRAQPYNESPQQSFTSYDERPSIDEYRHLVTNSVLRMKDSCRIYDYLLDVDKKWTEDDGKLEVAPYGGSEQIRSNREFFIHNLLRILTEQSDDESTTDLQPNNLFNLMLTRILATDLKLGSQLVSLLHAKCCRDALNCLEKREPRTIKKVKFHSWGGKRDGRNGIDDVPKIVLRTPFRPWGGKRSRPIDLQDDEWTNANR